MPVFRFRHLRSAYGTENPSPLNARFSDSALAECVWQGSHLCLCLLAEFMFCVHGWHENLFSWMQSNIFHIFCGRIFGDFLGLCTRVRCHACVRHVFARESPVTRDEPECVRAHRRPASRDLISGKEMCHRRQVIADGKRMLLCARVFARFPIP